MAQKRATFWRRNRWLKWVLGGLLVGVVALGVIGTVLARRAQPFLRAEIVEVLQKRFHARVELDNFHLSFGNGLHGHWGVWAEGRGLRIWPSREALASAAPATTDADQPLIRIGEFHFHAPLRFARGEPLRISVMQIEGLEVHVPPRTRDADNSGAAPASSAGASTPDAGEAEDNGQSAANPSAGALKKLPKPSSLLSEMLVERVECKNAQVVIETDKPGKLPLGFAIASVVLTKLTLNGPISYDADLTNPRPLGEIHAKGSFGPLQADYPADTPLSGDYRFDHADLSGFNGIAGILNSTGHLQGTVHRIVVDGVTDTPDFRLTHFGNPMPLHTNFHAEVDGTDGDTWLDPVDATLGHSHFTAQGKIVRLRAAPGEGLLSKPVSAIDAKSPFRGGHDIELTVKVNQARIEDFLGLTMKSGTPMLTGAVRTNAKLSILPGQTSVHERIKLDGSFTLDQARFTSAKIQGRIEQLSMRGQGRPKDVKDTDPASVESQMKGDFHLAAGILTLPQLDYMVPGADIQLKGKYGIDGGTLDFSGNAKMDATVSKMVGGWKGMLLKPVDRFFQKGGAGTLIPIHIKGTRDSPDVGIDFDRMKGTSAERPGDKQN